MKAERAEQLLRLYEAGERDFTGSVLPKANLSGSNLSGAQLSRANLREANLSMANLSMANLSGAKMSLANLREVDLSRANMGDAHMRGAILDGARLDGARLDGAILDGASLDGASLYGVDLRGAHLNGANLNGANMASARFARTVFGGAHLANTKGLSDARHLGPSYLDTESLKLAEGGLPEAFLQGCGFAEWEILASKVYNPRLLPNDLVDLQNEIYAARIKPQVRRRVFISYSSNDGAFVERMRSRLLGDGVICWVDRHDMKAGPIERQVDKAIGEDSILLLVLSENSIASDWVQHEVREGRKLEQKLGSDANVLCPVSLDDSWHDDRRWPRRIIEQVLEKHVLPFAGWLDPKVFDTQYRKLIDGLSLFYAAPKAPLR